MIDQRITKIFVPYLLSAIFLIAGYTFLHWLLVIRLDVVQPKEMYANFFIPAGIATAIAIWYIRKRLRLLKINEKTLDFLTFLIVATLSVPTIIAQNYIQKLHGKMSVVEMPSQINFENQTRYYSIKNADLLRGFAGVKMSSESADRYGTSTRVEFHFVAPLVDPLIVDTVVAKQYCVWLAKSYSDTFSSTSLRETDSRREILEKFYRECVDKFNAYAPRIYYLRSCVGHDDREHYLDATENSDAAADNARLLILQEEKGSYETRMGSSHKWIVWTFLGGLIFWFLLILTIHVDEKALKKFQSKKDVTQRRKEIKDFWLVVTPKKEAWAMPLILDMNVIVFLIMVLSGVGLFNPESRDLLIWGANYRPLVEQGEYWRTITSVFLHGGILHLLYNMFALVFVGIFLEDQIGSKRFFIVYMITGVVASISSVVFNEPTVSVGASGAIFGMYGLSLALILNKYVEKSFSVVFGVSIAIFVGLNVLVGFINGNIDMSAHFGGLIAGLFVGLLFFKKKKSEKN